MVVGKPGLALELARCLARLLRDEPTVRRLWVCSEWGTVEPSRESAELYLLVTSLDEGARGRIDTVIDAVNARFPSVDLLVHLIHAEDGSQDEPPLLLPQDAQEIPLCSD